MIKDVYVIIALTLILLITNIALSLYINSDDYYEENYLSHYYKLEKMPTIIPFDFAEPDPEFDYINEDFFQQYMEQIEDLPPIFNMKYNASYKTFNYCYSLLQEFVICLSPKNERTYKCRKLINEKMDELGICEIIKYNNNSVKNMKNNIIYFNFPNEEINNDIQEEFEEEKKFKEINDFSIENKEIKKNEEEKPRQNQVLALKDKSNEENLNNVNLDCIEYGLVDEHIICTKYE